MITRLLSLAVAKSTKSVLLLGPRQTGKSTLMAGLHPDLTIDLARERTYLDFARNPGELEERLAALKSTTARRQILVDEVQRLPSILNTIQAILDQGDRRIRFLLTGSSARKLRRGQANLLPGRIVTFYLGPIVVAEMDYLMNAREVMGTGCLPGIISDADVSTRRRVLRSYAATYLKEEVQAEALTRNLEGFARFLAITAEWAGLYLDLSKMSSSAQVPRQSAVRYFEILEDCLIVHRSPAFAKSARRRFVQHPRFFFFDLGVLNGLLGNFEPSPDRIGGLFEHLIFTQILHSAGARDVDIRLSSFRTEAGAEVDFIVECPSGVFAVEAKASTNVGTSDLRGLRHFAEYYGKKHRSMILYLGNVPKKIESVDIYPWQQGIQEMGF